MFICPIFLVLYFGISLYQLKAESGNQCLCVCVCVGWFPSAYGTESSLTS